MERGGKRGTNAGLLMRATRTAGHTRGLLMAVWKHGQSREEDAQQKLEEGGTRDEKGGGFQVL